VPGARARTSIGCSSGCSCAGGWLQAHACAWAVARRVGRTPVAHDKLPAVQMLKEVRAIGNRFQDSDADTSSDC
jgi:hypothetical protein